MNYLLVQVRTLVPSPRSYSEPIGLVVFDIPAFVWAMCHHCGYYESHPQLFRWEVPDIKSCSVWAFGVHARFRSGGRFEVLGDGAFRIVYKFGGATYATIKLKLNDLLTADMLTGESTYRENSKLDPDFGWRIRRYMKKNGQALIDFLGGLKSEQPEEPEYSTPFPGLSEDGDDDDDDDTGEHGTARRTK